MLRVALIREQWAAGLLFSFDKVRFRVCDVDFLRGFSFLLSKVLLSVWLTAELWWCREVPIDVALADSVSAAAAGG